MNVLGVRLGHDAGSALVIDGEIVASIAEERLTRIKNDTSFPIRSIEMCLKMGGLKSEDIDILALPNISIPEQFFIFFNLPQKYKAGRKGNKKNVVRPGIPVLPLYRESLNLAESCEIYLCGHHRAHAASAYFTSGLNDTKALVVTMDGAGDDVTCAFWKGQGNSIELLKKFGRDASLGWFYSNCTEAMGWRHGSGEWKLMGLAPYGFPQPGALEGFYPEFKNGDLIRGHEYGQFGRWNDHGANHYHGHDAAPLKEILSRMKPEDFAAEAQRVAEEQAFNLILPWIRSQGVDSLCCAGGFFLNVKFNQKLWYTGMLRNHWVYPDCGDSGLPVGAALDAFYSRNPSKPFCTLENLYFGPEFSVEEIEGTLTERGINYTEHSNVAEVTAKYLAENKVVGWFQGRMEAGPRALGNRSILMSPLEAGNKDLINAKVKYREKFRPFCPSILHERRDDYLFGARDEEFMVTSFEVVESKKDKIPAVVHEDGTARPQLVRDKVNPLYSELIREFEKITGEGVLLNTSFNVRGEPIVCTPREAIRCFYDTGLDVLVLGNFVVTKKAS